jgi:hypothetical protein
LETIERDGYRLRADYCEHHALKTWLEMVRLGFVVTLKHFAGRIRSFTFHLGHPTELNSKWNTHSEPIKLRKKMDPKVPGDLS